MVRRVWLSLGLVVLGGAMLVTSQLAAAEGGFGFRQGGVFRYGSVGASVQIDPQLAYVSTAWWMEYATAAKLLNWSDRPGPYGHTLVLEAASNVRISNAGRRYTFTIR